MIRDSGLHRGSDTQSLMDSAKIIISKPERDGCRVILDLLGKTVCQASEAPNTHSHGKILPFYKASAHMLWVGIAADDLHVTSDAGGGGIACMVLRRSTVNLLELCIVNIRAERTLQGLKICFVAVCGDLYPVLDSTGTIVHKFIRPTKIPTPN